MDDLKNFEPNSHKYNKEKEKKNTPIVSDPTTVTVREKSLGKKFSDVFLSDDVGSVKSFIFYDVIVPAIKDTIANVVTGGIELLLYGSTSRTRNNPPRYANTSNLGYVSYSSYSKSNSQPSRLSGPSDRYDYRDIVLQSAGEAEMLLDSMMGNIEQYGYVSVADMYEYCNISSNFTDNNYGWKNLSQASVKRTRGGYYLDLPKAIVLD